jgi:DNA-binding NarL/FixJ family response regulator
VHAGGRWIEQESFRRALESQVHGDVLSRGTLTTAELRVVELLAKGARNKEIAVHLNVAESTVKNHLHSVYGKLGLHSRYELRQWYSSTGQANRPGDPATPSIRLVV